MAIYEEPMYACRCDVCNERWRNSETGVIAYTDIGTLRDELSTEDWIEYDEKFYCPDCCDIDDDGVLSVNMYKVRMNKLKKITNAEK